MKKILSSLLFSFITITSLYSADGTSTLLEQLRAEKVEEFKNNIDAISARVNNYILKTADITVTRKELQVQDSLPYSFFNNFEGITCSNNGTYCNEQTGSDGIQISILSGTLKLTNVLGSTPNTYVVENFTNNSDNSRVITSESNYTVQVPLNTTTSNFISLIGKINLNSKADIGLTSPSDTTKTWYLANGTGGFDIKKYDTSLSKWVDTGSTGINGQSSVQANSEAELFEIPCLKNDNGFAVKNSIASRYVCSVDGDWIPFNNGSSEFNSDAQMLALVTTLMSNSNISIASVSDPEQSGVLNTYYGMKDFTKKSGSTNGYWVDSEGKFFATDSYETLLTITTATDGNVAFIPDSTKTKVLTLKRISGTWIYLADGYQDVVTNYDFIPTGKAYVMDMRNSLQLFGKESTYFVSYSDILTKDNKIFMAKDNRSAMPSSASLSSSKFLLVTPDCTSATCYGTVGNDYFAGDLLDGMKVFYYTLLGKQKNYLTDIKPLTWAEIWANQPAIAILSTSFGNVASDSLMTRSTLNGAVAYTVSGSYVNKSQGFYIPSNKLPSVLTSLNATITKYSGSSYVNVSTLDDFAIDTNLDVGYRVLLTGSGFTNKYIRRCTDLSDDMYWSDYCYSNSATVAITNGSRSDLYLAQNTTRVSLTKNVGLEANYTTTGIPYSLDAGWKQWYYSTEGINTNAMTDAISFTEAAYESSTGNVVIAKSVGFGVKNGIAASWSGKLWRMHSDGKVLSNSFTTTRPYEAWMGTYANDLGGMADNGLIYTGTSAPFSTVRRLDTEFGVTAWTTAEMDSVNKNMNTTNICATRGMRLPTLAETSAVMKDGELNAIPSGGSLGNANGVPASPLGDNISIGTWTATAGVVPINPSYKIDYFRWHSNNHANTYNYTYSHYIRCVR